MKHRIIPILLTLSVIIGCQDKGEFENRLFIDASTFKNEVRVATDEDMKEQSRQLTVSMAQPLSHDLEVSFTASPELLDTYRTAYYDDEAVLLPEGHCDLSGLKAVIKAGSVTSEEVSVNFVKLGVGEGLDYSKRYVLPVSISADGIEALPRAKTMYFVVREGALVNVAAGMMSNCAWPDWGAFAEVEHLERFTMEAMLMLSGLESDDQYGIKTVMGIEDNFLVRISDASLDKSQIQVAMAFKDEEDKQHRQHITSPNLRLMQGQWYHFALTFDGGVEGQPADIKVYINGKEKASGQAAASEDKDYVMNHVNFMIPHSDEMDNKPRCFWLGYSYNNERWFNGLMAEVRLWNKVLTAEEINASGHFYKLYPDEETGKFDDSLLAYWKFNEEKGKTVKDHSNYGNDLTGDHDFQWYPVELPAK